MPKFESQLCYFLCLNFFICRIKIAATLRGLLRRWNEFIKWENSTLGIGISLFHFIGISYEMLILVVFNSIAIILKRLNYSFQYYSLKYLKIINATHSTPSPLPGKTSMIPSKMSSSTWFPGPSPFCQLSFYSRGT